jgi:hypothetical protein
MTKKTKAPKELKENKLKFEKVSNTVAESHILRDWIITTSEIIGTIKF